MPRGADDVEGGLQRRAYLFRVKVPRILTNGGQIVAPAVERFIPLAEADHSAIVGLVRDRLRQANEPPTATPGAARSRAELHSAIVHQPECRAVGKDGVGI